jgi:hypothetical protein
VANNDTVPVNSNSPVANQNIISATKYISSVIKRTINGVEYPFYPPTITDEVYSAEGVKLTEILKSLATSDQLITLEKYIKTFSTSYRIRGFLFSDPSMTALEKLYAHVGMEVGDVYLVHCGHSKDAPEFEQYVYTGEEYGWLYVSSTVLATKSEMVNALPSTLGEPGTYLIVGEDGTSLEFSTLSESELSLLIDQHDEDPESHLDIRQSIASKAEPAFYYNDMLYAENWVLSPDKTYYQYIYSHKSLGSECYFSITPIYAQNNALLEIINSAEFDSSFIISYVEDIASAKLIAKNAPTGDIPIFVQVFSKINELEKR